MAELAWYRNTAVAIGRDGTLYCVGNADHDNLVWAMNPDFSIRRVQRERLPFTVEPRLAVDPNGRLLVWQLAKHSLRVLSIADGSTLAQLGGKEPEHAHAHGLDLADCDQLVADIDGSFLALIDNRLVRYDASGAAIPTWPPHATLFGKRTEKLSALYGPDHQLRTVESVYVESVGNHPLALDSATRLCTDFDGHLYAERSEKVAKFDRDGKRLYRVKLPLEGVESIAADGAGRLFVRGWRAGDPMPREILRVSADGRDVRVIATDRLSGGAVGREDQLVAAADGTLYLFGYHQAIRTFGPDGELRGMTARSREWEAEEDRVIAARA